MPRSDRVVVVGGGVAGLVAARALALAGREVLLLERAPRLGGQLASHSIAGIDLDAGADAYAASGEAVARIVRNVGLEGDLVTPRELPRWLRRADGRAAPLPATSELGIPGVPLARDVIAAVGPGAALRAQLDALIPGTVAERAGTLGEYVRRRMGLGMLEGLVDPVVRAEFGVTADELAPDAASPGLRATALSGGLAAAVHARALRAARPRAASLRGGMHRLIPALVAELDRFGVRVRTDAEVTAATPDGVTLGDGERITGEVVLAAPLSGAGRRIHTRVVTLAVDAPELAAAPRGVGIVAQAGDPELAALSLEHLSARWEWLAVATPLQLLRLRYPGDMDATPERARRDAELLLDTPLPHPSDVVTAVWDRLLPTRNAAHAIDGMRRVGEAESGPDLAAVIADAGSIAETTPSGSAGFEG